MHRRILPFAVILTISASAALAQPLQSPPPRTQADFQSLRARIGDELYVTDPDTGIEIAGRLTSLSPGELTLGKEHDPDAAEWFITDPGAPEAFRATPIGTWVVTSDDVAKYLRPLGTLDTFDPAGREAMLRLDKDRLDEQSQQHYDKVRPAIEAQTYGQLRKKFDQFTGEQKVADDKLRDRLDGLRAP